MTVTVKNLGSNAAQLAMFYISVTDCTEHIFVTGVEQVASRSSPTPAAPCPPAARPPCAPHHARAPRDRALAIADARYAQLPSSPCAREASLAVSPGQAHS